MSAIKFFTASSRYQTLPGCQGLFLLYGTCVQRKLTHRLYPEGVRWMPSV